MTHRIALLALLALSTATASAQQASPQLKATLDKLDTASARFTSAQADVHKVVHNALTRSDEDPQDGSIYFIREKGGATRMGLKTTGRDARTLEYKAGVLRVYNPAQVNCFDTIRKPGVETYLTLGFGGSGKDLAKAWDITDLGPETINGKSVEKLDLVPKDPQVKANFTRFTLWLDLATGVSVKQVFLSSSNDVSTATYTNIRLNGKVDTKPFEIKGKPCGK